MVTGYSTERLAYCNTGTEDAKIALAVLRRGLVRTCPVSTPYETNEFVSKPHHHHESPPPTKAVVFPGFRRTRTIVSHSIALVHLVFTIDEYLARMFGT